MPPPENRDLIAKAARIVREATRGNVTEADAILAGHMTHKVCVRTDQGLSYIVRMYPRGREHVARFEPALMVKMRNEGAAVPEIVSWSGPDSEVPHVVYRRIAGQSLDKRIAGLTETRLKRICASVIEQVNLISRIPLAGFGELIDADHGQHPSWAAFILEVAASPISTASTDHTTLELARRALRATARRQGTAIAPSLVWTDISPENIIVDDEDNFAGLIDFEGAMGLEPEATFGYLEARYHGTRFHRTCRGLFRIAQDRRHLPSLYAVVRALRLQPYLGASLPDGEKRDPLDEFLPGLRNACEELIAWGGGIHEHLGGR